MAADQVDLQGGVPADLEMPEERDQYLEMVVVRAVGRERLADRVADLDLRVVTVDIRQGVVSVLLVFFLAYVLVS